MGKGIRTSGTSVLVLGRTKTPVQVAGTIHTHSTVHRTTLFVRTSRTLQ